MPCGCSQRADATAYITAADVVNDDEANNNQNEEGSKLQHHKPPPRSTVITKTTKTTKAYEKNKLITTTVTSTTTTTTNEPMSDGDDDNDDNHGDDSRVTDLDLPADDGTVAVRQSTPAVQPRLRSFILAATDIPKKIMAAPPAAAAMFKSFGQPAQKIVVRRDFRTLTYDEQLRFCRALRKMMDVKPGWKPWTEGQVDPTKGPPPDEMMPCEYFRIASYHGWPYWGDKTNGQTGYCAHNIETFPAWHRAYMVEFERALQEADRALGGDGNIALHYWGWEADQPWVNRQLMPQMIRTYFSDFRRQMIPAALLKSVCDCDMLRLMKEGYKGTSSDEQIQSSMQMFKIPYLVESAMVQLLHNRAATLQNVQKTARSIEEPHNHMHNACGFPMCEIPVAAFHPIFWLHHSNVDRIYEAYLQHAKSIGLDPEGQFSSCNKTLYETPLNPFTMVVDGKRTPVMPHTVLQDTEALGYFYDKVPTKLKPVYPDLHSLPTLAVVGSIDPRRLRGRSYNFHAFLVKNGESFTPPTDAANLHEREDYAGADGFLGGKSGPCATCDQRGLIAMRVMVTDNLKKRELTRFDVRPEFMVETVGKNVKLKTLEDLGLTAPENKPVIMGPLIDAYKHANISGDGSIFSGLLFTSSLLGYLGAPLQTVSITNQHALLKYLAVSGYLGEEKRDAVINRKWQLPLGGARGQQMMAAMEDDTTEEEAGGEGDDDAPAAALAADGEGDGDDGSTSARVRSKPKNLDPTPIAGIRLAQTQLRLRPTGRLDIKTAIALADAWRYNTLPMGSDRQDKATFRIGSTVYYSISGPCYLDTKSVASDIVKYAIELWSEDIPLFFAKADDAHPANLIISFGNVVGSSDEAKKSLDALDERYNKTYPFYLSHVEIPGQPSTETPIKITLDTDWVFWMLQDTPQTQNPYSIKDFFGACYISTVLLHDIGNALGLSDSCNPDDVMNPFYSEDRTRLTLNDIDRIKRIYPWLKQS
ncbi:hypothetical protein Vafri_16631 [Volvox africanus]|uniref:Tyrosinase copper-binding domain-containing protein n=1 Tax=Volvox africanus TaxID=51714 RepID=A0A8J4BKA8_9CHLO|nr:hypothetical protein Vafri_16631 [Volvox africanus]